MSKMKSQENKIDGNQKEKKSDKKNKTIKVNFTLDLNNNRYSPDNPFEVSKNLEKYSKRSLEENIFKSIYNIFRTPSNNGRLEKLLELKPSIKNVKEVFSILETSVFRSEERRGG